MNILVLFDIDKTLIPGSLAHKESFSVAFKKIFGITTTIDIVNYHGMTDQQIIIEVLKKNRLKENEITKKMDECQSAMIMYFQEAIEDEQIFPLDGVVDLLDNLKEKNMLLGLVTGNLEQIAKRKLKRAGIESYFRLGGFGSDGINRADLVRLAIKRAQGSFNFSQSNNIFLFGDAPQDMLAAKDNFIKAIGITTGIYSEKELKAAGADYVLINLKDTAAVLNILKNKR